jgi:hypothetical protein
VPAYVAGGTVTCRHVSDGATRSRLPARVDEFNNAMGPPGCCRRAGVDSSRCRFAPFRGTDGAKLPPAEPVLTEHSKLAPGARPDAGARHGTWSAARTGDPRGGSGHGLRESERGGLGGAAALPARVRLLCAPARREGGGGVRGAAEQRTRCRRATGRCGAVSVPRRQAWRVHSLRAGAGTLCAGSSDRGRPTGTRGLGGRGWGGAEAARGAAYSVGTRGAERVGCGTQGASSAWRAPLLPVRPEGLSRRPSPRSGSWQSPSISPGASPSCAP